MEWIKNIIRQLFNRKIKPGYPCAAEDRDTSWHMVPVFISSTFNDMHAERDMLVKRVFPELREWCSKRRLTLVDIDLRWGVTETEAMENRNAVGVCLKNIDMCRPFFICFLGQRYGWQPDEGDYQAALEDFPGLEQAMGEFLSVTEHEVRHALFSKYHLTKTKQEFEPVRYPLFFKRSDNYLTDLSSGAPILLRQIYDDSALENRQAVDGLREKMDNLETLIARNNQIITYSSAWDKTLTTPELALPLRAPSMSPESIVQWQRAWEKNAGITVSGDHIPEGTEDFETAARFNARMCRGRLTRFYSREDQLSKVIITAVQKAILDRYPSRKNRSDLTPMKGELEQQEYFLQRACTGFVHRDNAFSPLNNYLEAQGSNGFLVVHAPAGAGKTTLLANWLNMQRSPMDSPGRRTLIFRFVGADNRSTTIEELLLSILEELESKRILKRPIPRDMREIRITWIRMLIEISTAHPLLLLIDGIDQFETGLNDLSWLPGELPATVKLVVSFKSGTHQSEPFIEECSRSDFVHICSLSPFNDEQKRLMIHSYLERYLKRLDRHHIDSLLRLEGVQTPGCPLFIKVLLSELRMFGAFSQLRDEIEKAFGPTPETAFNRLLSRLEKDPAYTQLPPAKTVPVIMACLAHSRYGLTLSEIADILHEQNPAGESEEIIDAVNLGLRQIKSFIGLQSGRYRLFYDSLKTSCITRYSRLKPEREWHLLIAGHFIRSRDRGSEKGFTSRMLSELPFHLTQAQAFKKLTQYLCDIPFLEAKYLAGMPDELLADYERAAVADIRDKEDAQLLSEFKTFARINNKQLRREPSLLLQLALNEPDTSGVCIKARQYLEEDSESRAYFTWQNKPAHTTPVRLTYPSISESAMDFSVGLDGENYAVVTENGRLIIMSLESGRVVLDQSISDRPCNSPVLAENKNTIAFIDGMNTFVRYQIRPFRKTHSVTMGPLIDFCRADHEFSRAALICDQDIYLYDMKKPPVLLEGHVDTINDCAFSPGGNLLATVSNDRSVRVWNTSDKRLEWFSVKHFEQVYACGFSPSGNYLVTASIGEIILWDTKNRKLLCRKKLQHGAVRSVTVCRENASSLQVVACGDDGTLQTVEVVLQEKGMPQDKRFSWQVHSGPLNQVACFSDQMVFLAADNHASMALDITKLKQNLPDKRHWKDYPVYTCFASGSIHAWGNSDGTLRIDENNTCRYLKLHHDNINAIQKIVFSGEFISAGSDGRLCLFSSDGDKKIPHDAHGNNEIRTVSTLDSGRVILSAGENGIVKSWDYDGFSLNLSGELKTQKGTPVIHSIADRKESGVYLLTSQTIEFWDRQTGITRPCVDIETRMPLCLAWFGEALALVSKKGDIVFWDKGPARSPGTAKKMKIPCLEEITAAFFSNAGLLTAHDNGWVVEWKMPGLDRLAVFPANTGLKCLGPGNNKNEMLAGGENGSIFVLQSDPGHCSARVKHQEDKHGV